ncbi:MAG: hypothetical protein IKJ61_01020, partial [Bacteroidaceae bacterium]|nr:hypothetical protein [Bacteroidaceae bacterium]
SKFLRYVWLQNPHLRLVNCGFEAFTSLELYFLFTPHTKEGDFWVTFWLQEEKHVHILRYHKKSVLL